MLRILKWAGSLLLLVGLLSGCASPDGTQFSIKLQSITVDLAKASHGSLVLYDDPATVCSGLNFENYLDKRGMMNGQQPFEFSFEKKSTVYLEKLPVGNRLTAFLIVYAYDNAKGEKVPMGIACQEKVRLQSKKLVELTFKLNAIPED